MMDWCSSSCIALKQGSATINRFRTPSKLLHSLSLSPSPSSSHLPFHPTNIPNPPPPPRRPPPSHKPTTKNYPIPPSILQEPNKCYQINRFRAMRWHSLEPVNSSRTSPKKWFHSLNSLDFDGVAPISPPPVAHQSNYRPYPPFGAQGSTATTWWYMNNRNIHCRYHIDARKYDFGIFQVLIRNFYFFYFFFSFWESGLKG